MNAVLLVQVWYCFGMQLGIVPLNGTNSSSHMASDLQALQCSMRAMEPATEGR
jgi:hypothetical protein